MDGFVKSVEYKSQIGQDKFVIETVFKGIENGYFVDLAAGDGVYLSNTYVLQNSYNWKGICIECNPFSYEMLKVNRNCDISTIPITANGGRVKFNAIQNHGRFSTLFSSIYEIPDIYKEYSIVLELESETLSKCLHRNNAPNVIQYLSLDIEGSEEFIFENIDIFEQIKPTIYLSLHEKLFMNKLEGIKKNKTYWKTL